MEEENEKCAREKYWSELDDTGKCERLRQQVKNQQQAIDLLHESVSKLIVHLHRKTQIVIPIDAPFGDNSPKGWRNTEYF